MFLSSSFLLAHAFAAPCQSPTILVTSPAPLAEDVPVDVVPAGLVSADGCGGATWEAELSIPSTGEVVGTATLSSEDGRVIEVDPGADLLADTTYRLAFTPVSGDGVPSEVGFTTGSGHSAGLDGVPGLNDVSASWSRNGNTFFSGTIVPSATSDGETFVTLAVEGGKDLNATAVTGVTETFLSALTVFTDAPDEVCVVARQRDIAGIWAESEPVCVAPSIEPLVGGCNAAPGSFGVASVLLGLLAARRIRR